MNYNNWSYYYKIDPVENRNVRSNMLYTPMISPDEKTFCMHWDFQSEYQTRYGSRQYFTEELIDFFFQREILYLTSFKNYLWAPEVTDIDLKNKMIFFKWYGGTCNNIIYGGGSLSDKCIDWKEQMLSIIKEILDQGFYKLSLYPHCYYIDNENILRTFDFYACAPIADPFIDINKIKGMIGPNSQNRFKEALDNDTVNLEILFKRALSHYIKWPEDHLLSIYKELFS